MKILLFGKNGQIGWELQRSLGVLGEVVAPDSNSMSCGDLTQPERVADMIQVLRPNVIVNAAAYTEVDKAESDANLARAINAIAPMALAQAAAEIDALLVQYSTDYVFDGTDDRFWFESDATNPLSVYGQTKLEGEFAIVSSGCKYLIFRTSWVYSKRGDNFAKTMLSLAQERECLKVVNDQYGAPTGADLVADVTAHAIRLALLKSELCGLYHLVAGGETTWHGYATHVISGARELRPDVPWKVKEIAPVPTSAFPTLATRPLNSRLDTRKLQQTFSLSLPHWQHGVDRFLAEITP